MARGVPAEGDDAGLAALRKRRAHTVRSTEGAFLAPPPAIMRARIFLIVATSLLAVSSLASAQEDSVLARRVGPAASGFEASFAAGYARPYGRLSAGRAMSDLAIGGIGNDLELGWRLTPELGVAVSAEYDDFEANSPNGKAARSLLGGAAGTLHLQPREAIDPWLSFGVGYRALWDVRQDLPNVTYQGLRVGRLLGGVDLRTDAFFSIAPVVGADMTVFLWQLPQGGATSAIAEPRVSTFFFAGVQGRVDFAGSTRTDVASRRPVVSE